MLLDPTGGIVLTNDGNAILREIDVTHPASKHIIELSRTQDDEVGDGTTTVIVLAGEILQLTLPYLETTYQHDGVHPIQLVKGLSKALESAIKMIDEAATKIDLSDKKNLEKVVSCCLGTKSMGDANHALMTRFAIEAVKTVTIENKGKKEIDIKRYARVEKVPGGSVSESEVLSGVIINKDVTHPKMRRRIENPRVILLDCPLEYKKGENAINVQLKDPNDFAKLIELEEEYVRGLVEDVKKLKPDVVFTEKGLTDVAAFLFAKAGITAFRRLRKTDNNRLARATGATIVHRTDELQESDVGTKCGLMEVCKIGDEYFVKMVHCKDPKACTILLRGPSRDVLNELERNLHDAMSVARNIENDPRVVCGGGAIEMTVSRALRHQSQTLVGPQQMAFKIVAEALEIIPRTLLENCGVTAVRVITELRAKHAQAAEGQIVPLGVDGKKGVIADMASAGIVDPALVKSQALKTAVEAACMLLRIDKIVSSKGQQGQH
jgi:T-complex protein 1 subunit gamma